MTKNDSIRNIVSHHSGVPLSEVTHESNLIDDLNLSPLDIVDLVTKITKQFQIELPDDFDIQSIRSVADLAQLVEQQSTHF